MDYFPQVAKIAYEGPKSKNPLAFKHYNPDEIVEGKTLREHLRFSVCYWHTFRATGITGYLTNGGRIEVAQRMAGHSNTKTTGLYDRRNDDISIGEIERIGI